MPRQRQLVKHLIPGRAAEQQSIARRRPLTLCCCREIPRLICQSAGNGHAAAPKLRADLHCAKPLIGQPPHFIGAHHNLRTAPDAAFLPCPGEASDNRPKCDGFADARSKAHSFQVADQRYILPVRAIIWLTSRPPNTMLL
jgi:hypothetical protein